MKHAVFGVMLSLSLAFAPPAKADEVAALASSIVDLQSVLRNELSTFPTLDGPDGVRNAVSSLARMAGENLACAASESPDIARAANEVTLLFQFMFPQEPATFTQIYVENQVRGGLRQGCNGGEVFDEVFSQAMSNFQFVQALAGEIQRREDKLLELLAD